MDIKFIAHIAIESLVIAAVSFYFYRRVSSLEQRVHRLEEGMMSITAFLSGNNPSPPPQGATQTQRQVPQQRQQQKKVHFEETQPQEEEFNEDDLDDLVDQELQECEQSEIQGECENGVCPL